MRHGDATTMATANPIRWSLPSLSFNTRLRRELSRVRGLSSKAKLSNRPELNYIFVVSTGGFVLRFAPSFCGDFSPRLTAPGLDFG